jgi:hypothetical protein
MTQILTTNYGLLIVSSTYWETEQCRVGKVFVSVNAGCIRVLLPPDTYPTVADLRKAKYAVLSRSPWQETNG